MRISDPFKINDWEIKKFLSLILIAQGAMGFLVVLDAAGIHIPVLRQLAGFVYLTVIPGALVLRALNIHKLDDIQALLYTVGLSIATVMATGFLINTLLPYIGIARPLTDAPVIITLSFIVFGLCGICYLAERGAAGKRSHDAGTIELKDVLSPPVLFLCILPLLAILGAYLQTYFNDNVFLVLLLLLIAMVVLLAGFDLFIPRRLFPLAIVSVGVSLLFHNSLISGHMVGYDIQLEYYFSRLALNSGYWDPTVYGDTNSMLSIVVFGPIYSIVSNLGLVWVLKIVYPLLFALVPLGLYSVFRHQTEEKAAFMASFFFMAMIVFYTEMIQLGRQEVAELYVVLILLLLIVADMDKVKRSVLLIAFSFSLALSHYGLTYIFMGSLIVAWAMLSLIRYSPVKSLKGLFGGDKAQNNRISAALVLSLIVFSLIWYVYTSGAAGFDMIVGIVAQIIHSIGTDLLNPQSAQGLAILQYQSTTLYNIFKYMTMFTQFCILIGVVTLLLKSRALKFKKEYSALAAIYLLILVAGIVVPFFASAIQTTRLYQIALIFLAPFFILGWQAGYHVCLSVFSRARKMLRLPALNVRITSLQVLSLFLAVFLVFNSGLIFVALNDSTPMSLSLNTSIDLPIFNDREVAGAAWLDSARDNNTSEINNIFLYSDFYRELVIRGWDISVLPLPFSANFSSIPPNSFLYFGTLNVNEGQVLVLQNVNGMDLKRYVNLSSAITNRELLYSNGGAAVYR